MPGIQIEYKNDDKRKLYGNFVQYFIHIGWVIPFVDRGGYYICCICLGTTKQIMPTIIIGKYKLCINLYSIFMEIKSI